MPVFGAFPYIIFIQYIDQLRERRRDPYAFLILHTLHPLNQHFFYDQRQIVSKLPFPNFIQIHEYCHERSLPVTGHQRDQLILDRLDPALYLVSQAPFRYPADNSIIQALPAFFPFFDHTLAKLFPANIDKRSQVCQRK